MIDESAKVKAFDSEYVDAFVKYRKIPPYVINKWVSEIALGVDCTRADVHDRLLDFGCGTGRFAIPLSNYFDVTGVDQSESMLAVARSEAAKLNFCNFVAISCDVFEYRTDNPFDAVFLSEALHLFQDLDASLHAAKSLLCNAGAIHIRTATKSQILSRSYLSYFPSALQVEVDRHYSIEHMVSRLLFAGFSHVRVAEIDESIYVSKQFLCDALSQRFHSVLFHLSEIDLINGVHALRREIKCDQVLLAAPMTYITGKL